MSHGALSLSMYEIKLRAIAQRLKFYNGNVTRTGKSLEISHTMLLRHRKILREGFTLKGLEWPSWLQKKHFSWGREIDSRDMK